MKRLIRFIMRKNILTKRVWFDLSERSYRRTRRTFWIGQVAQARTRGALHSQLEVPQSERIPKTLLLKIKSAKSGETIRNPTGTGKRMVPVTTLLKRRTNFALNIGYGRFPRRK